MEFSQFSPAEMETLEQYATANVLAMISLKSLVGFQKKALDLGILKEDEECRLNTLIWDIGRLQKLYMDQTDSVLERLPSTISVPEILKSRKAKELPTKRKKAIKDAN